MTSRLGKEKLIINNFEKFSPFIHVCLFIVFNEGSQMPRRVISDAHEWINEIPTVPTYYLANPQPRERAWHNQRGKKTLLSLTLV